MKDKPFQKDQIFLREALRLARKGIGWTNPNPLVGAVIVKDGHIIASGYHQKVGFPHAEIEAFNNAKTSVKDTTLYVNLEPCVHYGRTPPCVDVIIKSGVKRIVCSTLDPNPKVHGQGLVKLQKAGIEVNVGILESQSRRVNEAFFTFHEKKRPFIAVKFAASLDGKIATRTSDSKWITHEKARQFSRSLRSQYQAVLVGINTILYDNPHLGARIKGRKDPLRIILDASLKIPLKAKALRDSNVIIATSSTADKEKKKKLEEKGVTIISFNNHTTPLEELLTALKKYEIVSILVEGGGKTIGNFVDKKLVDKVYAFHAPILIGGEDAISAVRGEGAKTIKDAVKLYRITFKRFGDTMLTVGYRE